MILALTSVLPGLLIVALMPALLESSRGRPGAATQFEVYMAAMNLGSVAGTAVAGWLAPLLPLHGSPSSSPQHSWRRSGWRETAACSSPMLEGTGDCAPRPTPRRPPMR